MRLVGNAALALHSSWRAPIGGARSELSSHTVGNGASALRSSSRFLRLLIGGARHKLASRLVDSGASPLRSS